ncbi:uncharacterized protein [Watersipora subatra]|uniref:uncharacterized protein n=1 Tax=Watersipora subatra TaxID=2589382 RepID=UPI00355C599D
MRNKITTNRRRRTTQALNTTTTTTTPGPTTTHMDEGVTTVIINEDIILREPLTRSQVNRAQVAIRKLVDDHRTAAGHHPFNAGILRLSFHDCVGQLGCDGCINHNNRANSGVFFYAMKLDTIWREQFSHTMTQADFWALAGITVVQYSMELNPNCRERDCVPDIPFFWGRHDCGKPWFFTHTFCPIHGDATKFFHDEFGLNKTLYTALMGGHTLGRVNTFDGDTWDATPDIFDNDYYKQLINAGNQWMRANRTSVPELNESWTNKDGHFLMLGSDIALLSNITYLEECNPDPLRPECPKEPTRDLVEAFANDNILFLRSFVEAYKLVINKSPYRLRDVIEDTPFGPRWERPGTLPTFAPTTTTPTTTTPKPIVRGTAVQPADAPFKGAKFCDFNEDALCAFMEQMTNDNLDVEIVSGYQSPYGPEAAYRGRYYIISRGNVRNARRRAWIRILPFQGISGCLHLFRYQTGANPGRLTVYQAYGALYPGNEILSTDVANSTTEWVHEQYGLRQDTVQPNLLHELIIEFEMGDSGIIAIDDIIFDDRQDC